MVSHHSLASLLPLTSHEMNTLNTISQVLGLISGIAIIWLAVAAFRRKHILWGLGILFIPLIPVVIYFLYFMAVGPNRYHLYWPLAVGMLAPITASVYALNNWVEVKKLFLVYITSFVLSAGTGFYVFSASGGWGMMAASQDVARGIAQGNLTEKDALNFMNSNLDMIESSGLSPEQQKKMDFMREFMKKAEGGFSEEEQSEVQKKFKDMKNPAETSQTSPKETKTLPAKNGFPASREASLKRTPVVQSDPIPKPEQAHGPQMEDNSTQVTLIRFPVSGSGVKSVTSDALAETKRWVGRSVVVRPKKGVQQKGVLIKVSGDGLRIEKEMTAGSISLPFKFEEIDTIQRLR